MHTNDLQSITRTLRSACDHVGLAQTLDKAYELANLCECPSDSIGHEGLGSAAAQIAAMDTHQINDLIRVGTAHFHLLNKAEQLNIIRVNQQRERASESGEPRPESIDQAMHTLRSHGISIDRTKELLEQLDIQPTLTAHPTETRRRTILDKQADIATCVLALRRPNHSPHADAKRSPSASTGSCP